MGPRRTTVRDVSTRGRPRHPDVLTPTEWRVVDAVRHGMSNRQIAARRGVSLDAVKFHVANALAKLGMNRRSQLRSWRGTPVDSVLTNPPNGATMSTSLQLGPIGQISRTVSDVAQAAEWYRDVLRLPHLYTFGDLAFFDCGGTRLFLTPPEDGSPEDESVVYFRVEDIQAAYDELRERGVEFRGAPHLIFRHPSGVEEWMAFFDDPDGRPLAIMAQVG